MPELLILDVVCARPEAGSIEAGICSVVSYDACTRERGPVSTDDDIRLKALALIEFVDREDGESFRALLDRSDLREMVHGLAGLAFTWGTELAERQGYRSLAEKIADQRMAPGELP
jgi:hypothetical protein